MDKVTKLNKVNKLINHLEKNVGENSADVNTILVDKKNRLKICLQENEFIVPSYSIYGGFSGFQDYGVLGTRIKNKILNLWREFFLLHDDIEEIETPIVMKYDILKASGHVDRFTDYIVTDKDGNFHRADHLVKNYFKNSRNEKLIILANQVDDWDALRLEGAIKQYKILEPRIVNNVQIYPKVETTNLMYACDATSTTEINKLGVDFLRPELAQGIFTNFTRVKQFLRKDPPFGIAQIGKSFRKEISSSTFTRMREFTQAEIEYFVDPKDKSHPNWDEEKDYVIPILTSQMQKGDESVKTVKKVKLVDAITNGYISHQTMAYFLARIHKFAKLIGLNEDKIRFRQHLPNEMSHYASECWDLEAYVDGDWLECVGCADRGSYDLEAHSKHSQQNCIARRELEVPIEKTKLVAVLNKSIIGKRYKSDTPIISEYFAKLDQAKLREVEKTLEEKGSVYVYANDLMFVITKDMIKISEKKEKIIFEEYYPHTIEPSFGIDRLMYTILEHNFWIRESDENRVVLSLPHIIVPYDVAILPLSNKKDLINFAENIRKSLKKHNFSCLIDTSRASIGKRYSRIDEISIKYVITVDFDSLNDKKITIRDRDTTKQKRFPVKNLHEILRSNNIL